MLDKGRRSLSTSVDVEALLVRRDGADTTDERKRSETEVFVQCAYVFGRP